MNATARTRPYISRLALTERKLAAAQTAAEREALARVAAWLRERIAFLSR